MKINCPDCDGDGWQFSRTAEPVDCLECEEGKIEVFTVAEIEDSFEGCKLKIKARYGCVNFFDLIKNLRENSK